jgi:DNA primase
MRCWEKGVRNVVAPQGTAFTDTQARLLGRFAKEVVLCFDADNAGQNAAARSVDLLLAEGFTVRMALMPKGEDPDSFLRNNPPELFRERLAASPDYVTFLVRKAGQDHDLKSPAGLSAAGAQLAAVVAKIAEPIQQERALNFVSNQLQITPETLQRLVNRAAQAPQAPVRSFEPEADAPQMEPVREIEVSAPVAMLISLILEDDRLAIELQRKLNPAWIADLDGSALLGFFIDGLNGDDWDGLASFLQTCPEAERNALTRIALEPPPRDAVTTPGQLLEATLGSIHLRWVDRRIRILQNEIKSNRLDSHKLTELQELLATRSSRP